MGAPFSLFCLTLSLFVPQKQEATAATNKPLRVRVQAQRAQHPPSPFPPHPLTPLAPPAQQNINEEDSGSVSHVRYATRTGPSQFASPTPVILQFPPGRVGLLDGAGAEATVGAPLTVTMAVPHDFILVCQYKENRWSSLYLGVELLFPSLV